MDNINARNKDGSINEKFLVDYFKNYLTNNLSRIKEAGSPRMFMHSFFQEFNTLYPAPDDTKSYRISRKVSETLTSLCENKYALKRLGSRITKLRSLQNISISELARRAGMSAAFVCKLESGKSTIPKHEGIISLAKALEVDASELLSLVGGELEKNEIKNLPWNKAVEGILYDLGIMGVDKDDVLNFIEYKRWAKQHKKSLHQ